MDSSAVTSAVNQAMMSKPGSRVALDSLKVALESQKQTAAQLLSTVPEPVQANPPHMGNNIDVHA